MYSRRRVSEGGVLGAALNTEHDSHEALKKARFVRPSHLPLCSRRVAVRLACVMSCRDREDRAGLRLVSGLYVVSRFGRALAFCPALFVYFLR